jgi:DNA-binding transcriptional ArsR family regulator
VADKDKRELIPFGRFGWEKLIFRLHLPKELKTVAWAAAMWSNSDGSNVRPGLTLLADGLELSERQVGIHMDRLEELGLLELVRRGGIVRIRDGVPTTLPNVYQLTSPGDGLIPMRLDPDGKRLIDRIKKAPPKGRPDPKSASVHTETADPKSASGDVAADLNVEPDSDPKPTSDQDVAGRFADPKPTSGEVPHASAPEPKPTSGEMAADLDMGPGSDTKSTSVQEETTPGNDPKPASGEHARIPGPGPKPTSGDMATGRPSEAKPTSGETTSGAPGGPKPASGEQEGLTDPDPKPTSGEAGVDNSDLSTPGPKPTSDQGEPDPNSDPKPTSGEEVPDPKPSAALPEAQRSLTRSGLRTTNKDQPLTNKSRVVTQGGDLTSPPKIDKQNERDHLRTPADDDVTDDEYEAAWAAMRALPDFGTELMAQARAMYAERGLPEPPMRSLVPFAAAFAPKPKDPS